MVTCSKILTHKLTKGYDVRPLSVVTHVNDQPVKNLRQMIRMIKDNQEEFIIFRFEEEAVKDFIRQGGRALPGGWRREDPGDVSPRQVTT